MRIGMIGLGRMGANMVRRLHARRARVRRATIAIAEERRRRSRPKGARARTRSQELVAALPAPRAVWIMVPAAVVDHVHRRAAAAAASRRHRHRRRQHALSRGSCAARSELQAARHPLRGCRHERRRARPRARILSDDRRRAGAGRALEPVFATLALGAATLSGAASAIARTGTARRTLATCIAARTAPATS